MPPGPPARCAHGSSSVKRLVALHGVPFFARATRHAYVPAGRSVAVTVPCAPVSVATMSPHAGSLHTCTTPDTRGAHRNVGSAVRTAPSDGALGLGAGAIA